jgi:hypothetical protein
LIEVDCLRGIMQIGVGDKDRNSEEEDAGQHSSRLVQDWWDCRTRPG